MDAGSPVHVPHGHDRSVLVVDDDPRLAPLVRGLLALLGFGSVDVAHDCASAQAVLDRGHVALVICDLDLGVPGENGVALLRWMRQRPDLFRIPFIVTEETFTFDEIINAVNVGANGVLLKPYDGQLFRRKIEGAFRDAARRNRRGAEDRAEYLPQQTFAQGLYAMQEAMDHPAVRSHRA